MNTAMTNNELTVHLDALMNRVSHIEEQLGMTLPGLSPIKPAPAQPAPPAEKGGTLKEVLALAESERDSTAAFDEKRYWQGYIDGLNRPPFEPAEKLQSDGAAEQSWRCFHFGEVFTTDETARSHFGGSLDRKPGCIAKVELGGERGLLDALRNAEDELARHRAEDSDTQRELHQMQHRHSTALRAAEETGYARGLRDATPKPADTLAADGDELSSIATRAINEAEDALETAPLPESYWPWRKGKLKNLSDLRESVASAEQQTSARLKEAEAARESARDLCNTVCDSMRAKSDRCDAAELELSELKKQPGITEYVSLKERANKAETALKEAEAKLAALDAVCEKQGFDAHWQTVEGLAMFVRLTKELFPGELNFNGIERAVKELRADKDQVVAKERESLTPIVEEVESTARWAVEYVGSANYPDRERRAKEEVSQAFAKLHARLTSQGSRLTQPSNLSGEAKAK